MTWNTRKMSSRHEEDLAEWLGGRTTRNSGASWVDQTDGKTSPEDTFCFAWDGKATLGKSISVTRTMWAKVKDQAKTYVPAVPLRFYRDERCTQVDIDLIAIPVDVFAEMLPLANQMALIEQVGCLGGTHRYPEAEGEDGVVRLFSTKPCTACGKRPFTVTKEQLND